jgi:hypothetical protein
MHGKSLSLLHAGLNRWILDAQLRCLRPWQDSVIDQLESAALATKGVNLLAGQ